MNSVIAAIENLVNETEGIANEMTVIVVDMKILDVDKDQGRVIENNVDGRDRQDPHNNDADRGHL